VARLLPALVPPGVLAADAVGLDLRVLGFAIGLSIATGLLFGVAPAMQPARVGLTDAIGRGGRTIAGADRPLFRRLLVIGQIALAVLLVIGAGLMARGLASLQRIDPGYRTGGLLVVDLSLRGSRYDHLADQRRFVDDVTARVRALPGVEAAGATSIVPLSGGISGLAITIEGQPAPPPGQEPAAQYRVVTPGYLEAMGVPLREGRLFAAGDARISVPLIRWWAEQAPPAGFDRPQAMPVAIVNETMARQHWGTESPIGRRFRVLFSPWITIVGVVADTRNVTLRDQPGPEFYLTASQEPQRGMSLMVRTAGPPLDAAPLVRNAVRGVDPDMPISMMRTMADVVGRTFSQPRFVSALLAAFAVIALTLMVAGVYGLVAFTTARRRPEIGVRIALGAPRGQIQRMILREGVVLAAVGLAAGVSSALLAGRLIAVEFYGVAPTDGTTFATVSSLTVVVVIAACWLPARRASRVDPVVVLRQE
jgi:putative ABC transport system permease protein